MLHKIITDNEQELIQKLSNLIEKISTEAIKNKNIFYVGFSGKICITFFNFRILKIIFKGGSVVKFLCEGLPGIKTDFSKWKIAFCDERVVPVDSPDSTFGVYKKELLQKVPIKEEQFLCIKQGVSGNNLIRF